MDPEPKALRLATYLTTVIVVLGCVAAFFWWWAHHEAAGPTRPAAPASPLAAPGTAPVEAPGPPRPPK